MKRIICIAMAVLMCFAFSACGSKDSQGAESGEAVKVAIEVKDFGTMTLELYPDVAPKTVENFLAYVNDGFYDGLTFHRIVKGFMIQGGDPTINGSGKTTRKAIKGEFSSNGVENNLAHERGVISMARTSVKDSATSQFFICHEAAPHLDGDYAAFGKVIDGLDVLDAIAAVDVTYGSGGEKSSPITPVVIEKIYTVD